ncbi:MAG: GHKL domain-containing protein [Spirochaetaceae bacterium]|jgi:two-component system phosphate regulon sensor histidine kinase PhoR|nr:GHKL domain-containing protein [Spirochaetaceae bacterium]
MKTVFHQSLGVLSAAALGLCCFFTLAILIFMNSLYYETNTANLRETALLVLSLLDPDLFTERDRSALHRLSTVGSAYRISLISTEGQVFFDSQFDQAGMDNHLSRPEVAAALAGHEGQAMRTSKTAGIDTLYRALPVFQSAPSQEELIGVLRLSQSVPSFRRRILSAALPYLYLPLLIIALAIIAVYLFSRSLGRSFARLVAFTKTVSAQAYTQISALPPVISNTDEFRALETALWDMASELTRRMQEIQAEGRLLHGVLNGMNEAVFAVDQNLMLRLVNPRAAALFAIPSGREIQSLSFLEATHSTDLEAAARTALEALAPSESELNLPSAAARHCFRVFAGPLNSDNAKQPSGAIIVLEDISQLKRLEQVRKDFVANVSHELRTPIQLIKGYAETLLDMLPENAQTVRHGIGIIQKNALSMENLTTDLLTLAMLEDSQGSRPLALKQPLKPLLEEAVQTMTPFAREKGTQLSLDCPHDLQAPIYGSLIVQALINLLDNAIKYTPAQTRVQVRAFQVKEERSLIITVSDSGCGIPAEHLERIFERFYRIDKARSRNAGGTGLGLSIVRHIALMHQGSVSVESRAGEGSVFSIKLPVA